ncbi:MAG: DUF2147 domain-containing protein [Gammaproteobacteria bacterium]|nr:DUF2147 domain-containing protein [Gammaproteobacteria bacterium]
MTLVILFSLVQVTLHAETGDAHAIVGTWLTGDKTSRVEIKPCGDEYCGTIVWLEEPAYPADDEMAGEPKVDRNNPNESLQGRPILGLPMLEGFHYAGDGVWKDGTIYDPRNGKTYSCKMTLVDDKTLKVRGYIGFSLIGRTTVWTR